MRTTMLEAPSRAHAEGRGWRPPKLAVTEDAAATAPIAKVVVVEGQAAAARAAEGWGAAAWAKWAAAAWAAASAEE
eukprot:jgi/Chrpa1/24292/Chrysochromulina_OHIO_Genome00001313-RA